MSCGSVLFFDKRQHKCYYDCDFCTICASRCLKLYIPIFDNFAKDVFMDEEERNKLWKSAASGSGYRNFLKDSSTLQDRAFYHSLAYIPRKTDWIFTKILPQKCLSTRQSPLDRDRNRLDRGLCIPSAFVSLIFLLVLL